MDSTKKLLIALGILAALIGGVYMQSKSDDKHDAAHTPAARAAELPNIEISEEVTKTIDTIELVVPAKADAKSEESGAGGDDGAPPTEAESQPTKIVLTKKGEDEWELKEPVGYKANASNVTSLLNNLKSIKVTEQIASTNDTFDKWGVSDQKGLHAVFKKGEEVVLDAYFGDSGSRGQMTRLKDKQGVYAVKGYSKYLYERDAAGWRDKTIFKFEDKDAVKVTVSNEHGVFVFEKVDNTWKATLQPPKATAGKAIDDFKASKVDDLLRAYKSLSAGAFGDDKKPADVGLTEPKATVTIELKDGAKHVLTVGDTAEGTNRWVQASGRDALFSVSSWSADWALAEASKFQDKKKEEKKEDGAEEPSEHSDHDDE